MENFGFNQKELSVNQCFVLDQAAEISLVGLNTLNVSVGALFNVELFIDDSYMRKEKKLLPIVPGTPLS